MSKILYLILFLKALFMCLIILFSGIGLGPDEAQYFTWSQHLDFGYYSKPPGIAWQIFLSTLLFGPTELGVRFSAVVIGTLFSFAVYRLARVSDLSCKEAVFAALISALTPIGIFSTFLAITDGGMLLFWTLGLIVLMKGIQEEKEPSYLYLGLFIAAGALFKWPIYLLWVVVFAAWIYFPSIRSFSIVKGLLVSLLGLLPTLYWNSQHEFATFRHVFATVQGGDVGEANPVAFFLSQAGLLFPVFFILLFVGFLYSKKKEITFLGAVSLTIIGVYTIYACFKKGQGNWCLFAYPSAFVFIAAIFRPFWIYFGLISSACVTFLIFMLPWVQANTTIEIPWKMNPFRQNVGLDVLKSTLASFDLKDTFLASDKYQNVSQLSFYSPNNTPSYFFNLMGFRKNQFSFWPGPKAGQKALFIVIENEKDLGKLIELYPPLLAPYFSTVHPPEKVSLFKVGGESVKGALIFPCEGFKGILPKDPEKY